jgi:hypothetical protein
VRLGFWSSTSRRLSVGRTRTAQAVRDVRTGRGNTSKRDTSSSSRVEGERSASRKQAHIDGEPSEPRRHSRTQPTSQPNCRRTSTRTAKVPRSRPRKRPPTTTSASPTRLARDRAAHHRRHRLPHLTTVMATQHDRREAAEILRKFVATLPEPSPTQVAFLMGAASGLDEGVRVRGRP